MSALSDEKLQFSIFSFLLNLTNESKHAFNDFLDTELFKMSMMNQLNKNPELLEQYIDWHDSKFANQKDTKQSKNNRLNGITVTKKCM